MISGLIGFVLFLDQLVLIAYIVINLIKPTANKWTELIRALAEPVVVPIRKILVAKLPQKYQVFDWAPVVAIIAIELGKMVSKETPVDILVTPVTTIFSAMLVAKAVCPAIAYAMYWLGTFVNTATEMQPLLMGILVSVVVGIILTLPISSAAICAMIGISGLAGGAATAGCCAQMIGFAVISFRENKWSGLVAQGLGTSMLQMGNIVKNPRVWIPATLASAITGPLSTLVFKLECTGVAAGMGTCGLVGPLGILKDMGGSGNTWLGIAVVCILAPAVLSLVFSEILRKIGWIRENDLKLEL